MGILIWLVVGGLIGWAASVLMGTNGQQGIILNVIVGIFGAALGGWLFSGIGGGVSVDQGSLSISAIAVSLLGAIILLWTVTVFRGSASH